MHCYFLRFRHLTSPHRVSNGVRTEGTWAETQMCAMLPWPIEYASDIRAVEEWASSPALTLTQQLVEWRELKGGVRPGAKKSKYTRRIYGEDLLVMTE